MSQYEIQQAVAEAIRAELPKILKESITLQSKIDALPDICTQGAVSKATGIHPSTIRCYITDGIVDPVYIEGSNTPRIRKADVLEIILRKKYNRL